MFHETCAAWDEALCRHMVREVQLWIHPTENKIYPWVRFVPISLTNVLHMVVDLVRNICILWTYCWYILRNVATKLMQHPKSFVLYTLLKFPLCFWGSVGSTSDQNQLQGFVLWLTVIPKHLNGIWNIINNNKCSLHWMFLWFNL